MDEIIKSDSMVFTFEGHNEVDAVAVAEAILGMVKISKKIVTEQYPDVQLSFSVSAIKPGSLQTVFHTVAQTVPTLLTAESIEYAHNVLEGIVAAVQIKGFLKGSKPKNVTSVSEGLKIENAQGEKMIAPKDAAPYFRDCEIDSVIVNVFNGANSSPNVTGITITKSDGGKLTVPKHEFENYTATIIGLGEEEITRSIKETRNSVLLFVRKPDLLGNTKWELRSDRAISADIGDEDFLEEIHTGKQTVFAGMGLIADLQVELQCGFDGMPIEKSTKYTVIKVHKIIDTHDDGQLSF